MREEFIDSIRSEMEFIKTEVEKCQKQKDLAKDVESKAHKAQEKHLAHLKILDNMLGTFQQDSNITPQEPTPVPETNIDEDDDKDE